MSTTKTIASAREKRSAEVYELDPNQIVFEEGFNRRRQYTGIEELAQTIKMHGQVNPIQVFKARSGENKGKYVARIGHRRTLAAQLLATSDPNFTVKAIKLKSDDPKANLLLQFTSQTEVPLTSVEKGSLINSLKDDHNMKNEEIQLSLGISSASLNNFSTQARMPESVQEAISNGDISGGVVNTFVRDVRAKLNTERADNFSEQVLSAVEGRVAKAVAKAKEDGTKGRKGATVTGADIVRKPTLTQKLKEVSEAVEAQETPSYALKTFAEVLAAIEAGEDMAEVVAKFG
jgi:ParB/RepB/Spo0J family partition protein